MLKAAAALAIAGVLLTQARRPPTAPVTLKFGWRAGTTALVETDYQRKSGLDPAPDELVNVRMTHRMRVVAHREGLELRFEDQRHIDSSGSFEEAAAALLHLWTPQTIVAADGTFLRIEGAERVEDLVLGTTERVQEFADQAPALRSYLAPLLGLNALQTAQREAWDKLVWQWIGLSSAQPRLELPSTEQVIGVQVPATRTVEIIGRVRCPRAGVTYDCLTIEMRTVFDSAGLKAAFDKLSETAGRPNPGVMPGQGEQTVRVTLETATMLPHEALQTRTMHLTLAVNGTSLSATESETRRSHFTYDATSSTP